MKLNVVVSVDGKENVQGISAVLERLPGAVAKYRAKFVNETGKAVKLDYFRFSGFEFSGAGADLRLYREGWTAVSAISTVRYGECDMRLDKDYMPFAVSEPSAYTWEKPNTFSAENVVVLNNRSTGNNLLAGFISSAHFYNRFQVELAENGLKTLDAYVLGDGRTVDPGAEIVSEELVLLPGKDGYGLLERFAELWAERMNARKWEHAPTGWCSWYYYFSKVTEDDVVENLEFFSKHKEDYPIEYFQIDDGYQRTPGDWLQPSERFPHGIAHTVKLIKDYGFKPGLWFAPFMVCSDSELYREHPEYLLKDADGNIIHPVKWRGTDAAFLDCTREDVLKFLRDLFSAVRSWGCAYIKLDFMMYESCITNAVYHDKYATRCEAYRRGMEAIREGIGDDALILGGTIIVGPSAGIVNACRYGSDITPYWRREHQLGKEAPAVPNVIRNLVLRRYMHWRMWVNDPDVIIARKVKNELTENEIILWLDAVYMVGGSLLLADRMPVLEEDRAALCRDMMQDVDALQDVRPEDFFEREVPRIWSGVRKRDGKTVLGLFNPDEEKSHLSVEVAKLAFPAGNSWKTMRGGQTVTAVNGVLEYDLEPHSSIVLIAE